MTIPAARQFENATLLAASRCPGASSPAIAGVKELDWRYLLDAAGRQGVAALLRQWLAEERAGVAPDWARASLDAAYWGQHFRNRLLRDALHTLLERAAAAAIPVMPLKGAALVHGYYPAPALRPMSDLDLLVPPAHAERMADLLHACGYLPIGRPAAADGDGRDVEHAFAAHRAEGTVLVEYRTEPLDPVAGFPGDLDRALAARLRAHAARMWERGVPDTSAGVPVVRVAPEDLLLHIASHLATRHAGYRLIWLHDLCRVVVAHPADFDWRYFWGEAASLNLTVPVEAALAAAHRWLGAPCSPDGARPARLQPVRAIERRIIMRAVAGLGRADLAAAPRRAWGEAAVSFCRLTGARPRARALAFFVAPSREYLAWWMAEQGKPAASYGRMLLARWRRIGSDLLRAVGTHLIAAARAKVTRPR